MTIDIDAWKRAGVEILHVLCGDSESPLVLCVLFGAGFLAWVTAVSLTARLQGLAVMSWGRALFAGIAASAILAAAELAAWLYVSPLVPRGTNPRWVLLGAAGIVVLLVVLPLLSKLQKSNYFQALISLMFGIAAAVGVVALGNELLDASRHGKVEFGSIKESKDDLDQLINKSK